MLSTNLQLPTTGECNGVGVLETSLHVGLSGLTIALVTLDIFNRPLQSGVSVHFNATDTL